MKAQRCKGTKGQRDTTIFLLCAFVPLSLCPSFSRDHAGCSTFRSRVAPGVLSSESQHFFSLRKRPRVYNRSRLLSKDITIVAESLLWSSFGAGVCELRGWESAPEEPWLGLSRDHPGGPRLLFALCSKLYALRSTLFAVLLLACTSSFLCYRNQSNCQSSANPLDRIPG